MSVSFCPSLQQEVMHVQDTMLQGKIFWEKFLHPRPHFLGTPPLNTSSPRVYDCPLPRLRLIYERSTAY